jgi:hypothetical protein
MEFKRIPQKNLEKDFPDISLPGFEKDPGSKIEKIKQLTN